MPPSNFKRKWIKLFIDECLTGTIREDLTPDERSVWYDFLLFAGRNRPPGCISANETTAISPRRLAALLNISTQLLARATKKFQDSERITINDAGVIRITNWEKYQYSDYDRQKPYRDRSDEAQEPQGDGVDWEAEAKRITKELGLAIPFTAAEAKGYTEDLQREAAGLPIDMTGVKQD